MKIFSTFLCRIAIEGVKKKLKLKASSQAEAKMWADFFQELFKFVSDNQARASKYITAKREKLLKVLFIFGNQVIYLNI